MMFRFFALELRYWFNKKNIISYLIVVSFLVISFNSVYTQMFTSKQNENYTRTIQQIQTQYFQYVKGRFSYNAKIYSTVITLDPIIVIADNFFQVMVPLLMFLWFHSYISREREAGLMARNVLILGRNRYLLTRFLFNIVMLVPALVLMEFLTVYINQNQFLAVNMDRQWPYINRLLISHAVYFMMVFVFITIISVFSHSKKKSLLYSTWAVILHFVILNSFLRYFSPFFYRDWMFHPNSEVFITQLLLYVGLSIVYSAIALFYYQKVHLNVKQEDLKC